jgi:DNA primase
VAYPREEIDRVRERTDLAELAAEITKVKRSGRSVMAVCPFHQEKTPSLSIDGARGLYHCFGCGKSGDVFRWVQETNGLDFRESVEFLARRAGVTLTEKPGAEKRRGRREELVRATEAAVEFYHERLKTGDDAGDARSYIRGRGYDGEIVGKFLIGYSPDSWDTLTRHLKARKFSEDVLVGAGLASKAKTGRLVDRFRGRVMFPIHDLRGDPVGFGARLLLGDGPKYLNSPETQIYHKSRLLYGLNWAKSDIVRSGQAVVVEGYTDVIGFAIADMPVAVATCGTALGEEHLDLLRRFTERVVLAFDADEAGAGAALRGFEKSVPGDLDLRVAALPVGRDPADLVFDGEIEALRKATSESIPLLQFRIEQELGRFDLTEAEARGRGVGAAAELIARHPAPVVRHEYAVLLSRRTGVDLPVVEQAVARAARRAAGRPDEERRAPHTKPLTGEEKVERELLRLVLANDPELRGRGAPHGIRATLAPHLRARSGPPPGPREAHRQ